MEAFPPEAPLVDSLLDTDLYKLLMLQLIWRRHADVPVTFTLVNRTTSVRLADEVPLDALRAELDHVQALSFRPNELAWLADAEVFGRRDRFAPEFLAWVRDLRLPDYELGVRDGQLELRFTGPWARVTLWEIPALSIVSGLRGRYALQQMQPGEARNLYACATGRMELKLDRLAELDGLQLSDFGTRRRHSLAWQRRCLQTFAERLGPAFRATSNVLLARELGLSPSGTNGHEIPMVLAALAADDEALAWSPYQALEEWAELYDQPLRILLPDTFGSAAFFARAPEWVARWRGVRPDSAPPVEAGEATLAWWRDHGRDPREMALIFSDALDLDDIVRLHRHFEGRAQVSFGWGTRLTNDLEGCAEAPGLKPISLVCKVTRVAGQPAVKLSDNPAKATGEPAEVARYLRVFGQAGREARSVAV